MGTRSVLFGGIIACLLAGRALAANPLIKDIFDRDITQRGVTLIDWEGYMANPAIEFEIVPPSDAAFPIQAAISAREPRLYFDLPSEGSASGPTKKLTFANDKPMSMAVAIFPAREKKKKEAAVNIQLTDAKSRRWQVTLPVHVIVTEHEGGAGGAGDPTTKPGGRAGGAAAKPEVYPIHVDFSQDTTGVLKDENRRKIFDQAVQDWAFYFAPIPLKEVPAGAEKTGIWEPTGFLKSDVVTNKEAYTGFLLYAYGVRGVEKRWGGEPSRAGGFQESDGVKLPIRRSGGVEVEVEGNRNDLGYNYTIKDEEWFKATNTTANAHDFYSIAHHESGHALIFEPNNSKFKRSAVLKDDAVREYLGKDPPIDSHDHLDGIIDPASLHGGFGNEYHGKVPNGRWIITKLDLLVAQAIGYKLRPVDALVPLGIVTTELPAATARKGYHAIVAAQGGIPFYDWSVSEGKLPAGLSLNRFTGEITGTPTAAGDVSFTLQVRDYVKNGKGSTEKFTMNIGS